MRFKFRKAGRHGQEIADNQAITLTRVHLQVHRYTSKRFCVRNLLASENDFHLAGEADGIAVILGGLPFGGRFHHAHHFIVKDGAGSGEHLNLLDIAFAADGVSYHNGSLFSGGALNAVRNPFAKGLGAFLALFSLEGGPSRPLQTTPAG